MKIKESNKKALQLFCILLSAAALIGIALISNTVFSAEQNTSIVSLRINEVLSSNSIYANDDGIICDWIEIYNDSDSEIDISGYGVTDNDLAIYYTFPSGTVIAPKGYILVYCSRDYIGDFYAPFGISRLGGETISLIHKNNMVIDSVTTAETPENAPMILVNGQWTTGEYATPGFSNDAEGFEAYKLAREQRLCTVKISEVMSSNESILACRSGNFYDWIELTNYGDEPCSLSGFYLSDSEDDIFRWKLPNLIIEPGESRVVFASGLDITYDDEIHTGFSISGKGETIILSTPFGETVDSFVCPSLAENCSAAAGEDSDSISVSAYPTPGFENSESGYEQFMLSRQAKDAVEISEVCTSNNRYLAQQDGKCYDWVELHNTSSSAVSLGGWCLSNDADDRSLGKLPDVTLEPDGYLVIMCSGMPELSDSSYTHLGFTLGADEENLYLTTAGGMLSDYVCARGIPYDGSFGRMAQNGYYYFSQPTPGAPNHSGTRMVSEKPVSRTASGSYRSSGVSVQLSGSGQIHYTLDGSVPDSSSPVYSEPLSIDRTDVVRAVSIEPGKLPSSAVTLNYIVGTDHDLPIVCLSCDPDDMFGTNGIYTNIESSDTERLCNMTFIDGDEVFSIDCGIKLHGSGSRYTAEKKSFEVKFRGRYDGSLNYDIFGDGEIVSFSSLVLRSGEDYRYSIIRDELCTSLAADASSSVLTQKYRYCVLYINGEYWGVYAIREDLSDSYYASHYAVDPETVSMIRANAEYHSPELYSIMRDAQQSDLSSAAEYERILSKIDADSFIDWAIFEAYFRNTDIPGNIKYFISEETGGRWQVALFDLDWSMYRNASMSGVLNPDEEQSILLGALLKNRDFADRFMKRANQLFQNELSDRSVLERIDTLTDIIDSEMERDCQRWGRTKKEWKQQVDILRESVTKQDRQQDFIRSLYSCINLSEEEINAYFD